MKTGWKTIKLGELCGIARGGSPRPIQQFLTDDANGINWIKIGDTKRGGRYIDQTEEKIKPEGAARSRFVKPGSFLLSNSMSFGRPYILRTSGCIHDGWLVLEPNYSRVDQGFLYHLLSSPLVYDQFDRLAAGSTVRNLNIGLAEVVDLPLPPLEEQQRIVAILDEAFVGLDRARANAEANLHNARELFQRSLDLAFVELSEAAPIKTIGQIADIRGGKRLPPGGELKAEDTGFPYISIKDFTDDGSVDPKTVRFLDADTQEQIKRYIINSDDLYISIAGTIGKTGIVPPELDGANLTENAARLVFEAGVSNEYVYLFSRTTDFQDQAGLNTRTAAQPKLALSRLSTITLPLAEPQVQAELISRMTAIREISVPLSATYIYKINRIEALRQSLLQVAFAGELT